MSVGDKYTLDLRNAPLWFREQSKKYFVIQEGKFISPIKSGE